MKIDFYILENASKSQAERFTCQLIETAYTDNQTIYIHTASAEETSYWDNLLWTYRDDSFTPHNQYTSTTDQDCPIQIGHTNQPNIQNDILINLSNTLPGFYQQFSRLIEIVFNDPLMQQSARERYRQYREHGHELNTHKQQVNDL